MGEWLGYNGREDFGDMITLRLTCPKDDKYNIFVCHKKAKAKKVADLPPNRVVYEATVSQSGGTCEVRIQRTWGCAVFSFLHNLVGVIGLAEPERLGKVTNKMRLVLDVPTAADVEVGINISNVLGVTENRLHIAEDMTLLEHKNLKPYQKASDA